MNRKSHNFSNSIKAEPNQLMFYWPIGEAKVLKVGAFWLFFSMCNKLINYVFINTQIKFTEFLHALISILKDIANTRKVGNGICIWEFIGIFQI